MAPDWPDTTHVPVTFSAVGGGVGIGLGAGGGAGHSTGTPLIVQGAGVGLGGGSVSGVPVVIPPTLPLQPASVLNDVQLISTGPMSFTSSEPVIVTGLLASSADQVPLTVIEPENVTDLLLVGSARG